MNLSPTEVDAFLKYLFTTLARKPKRLKLHQTAQVARHLHAIVYEMREGEERSELERLTDTIWLAISRFAEVKLAGREDVIGFLRQHSGTYLNSFDIQEIEKFIEGRPAPIRQPFRPPALMGTDRSLSTSPARLQDDLTERIFIAYHALRRIEVKGARRRVADALNQLGIETGARSKTATDWGADEVIERVKQFQDQLDQNLPKRPTAAAELRAFIEDRRSRRVDSWITEFRRSHRREFRTE